ncbi:hypothetical protein [Pimelobacter simplex]|uniref:hypothetical protein n=1 Tax=Nocardioides simplex TaxID=2045 RepID=UPI003AAB03D5
MRGRARLLAAALPLALALAACSGGDAGEGGEPRRAEASAHATDPPPERTAKPRGVRIPAEVPNRQAKRAAVEMTGCAATDDGWAATGTAAGAGKARARAGTRTFVISVFFTTDQATVVGWGRTRVQVPAGGSEDWTVAVDLPVTGDLRCVLRGVG